MTWLETLRRDGCLPLKTIGFFTGACRKEREERKKEWGRERGVETMLVLSAYCLRDKLLYIQIFPALLPSSM